MKQVWYLIFVLVCGMAEGAVPGLTGRYAPDGTLTLIWEGRGGFDDEAYRVYCNDDMIAEVDPELGFEVEFTIPHPLDGARYQVGIWQDGHEVGRTAELVATSEGALKIDPASGVMRSRIFPVAGQPERYAVTVRNHGAKRTDAGQLEVIDAHDTPIALLALPALAPGEETRLTWEYAVPQPGRAVWRFLADGVELGHMEVCSFARPFHVMWYGAVPELAWVDLRQGTVADIPEFRRRGAYAGVAVGSSADSPEALLKIYRQILKQGFDALYIDEIMGDHPSTELLLNVLPTIRQEYPDTLIVVWNIQCNVSPRIAELVKAGVIDLLALEIYIKPREDIKRIDEAAEAMRRLGIADRVLIGLVTDKTWAGGASDDGYIASLLAQIRHLQQVYPESPGVAFWSADAPPRMREAAEALIQELYFQPKKEK